MTLVQKGQCPSKHLEQEQYNVGLDELTHKELNYHCVLHEKINSYAQMLLEYQHLQNETESRLVVGTIVQCFSNCDRVSFKFYFPMVKVMFTNFSKYQMKTFYCYWKKTVRSLKRINSLPMLRTVQSSDYDLSLSPTKIE